MLSLSSRQEEIAVEKAYLSGEESDIRLCQASGPTHKVPPTSPPHHPSFVRLLESIDHWLFLTQQWVKERVSKRESKQGWGGGETRAACFSRERKRKGRKGGHGDQA